METPVIAGDLFQWAKCNAAAQAREEGLDRVTSNNATWMEEAMRKLSRLPSGRICTGEGIRITLQMGAPKHPNAWGALIRQGVRLGYLKKTGEYRPMKTKKSHGRETPVYMVTT